ncbi:DUF255 domain-containing protein [Mucilaginibacter limnophilus]|uniref:DUF255 domain-containing protein n=1 Tax=Mucilaginibacter limnophilus TaxID=1932778 RepID=A0A3S2XZP7_9SPHI|nr:thioredoxin family protein [Mucilaginibacter limnophilus]RVU00035.1 DUF255 domain-containing protein [Mucilaginibacter limnophilus]
MKLLSAIALLFVFTVASAQDKGMHFEHNLTWAQIKAKAKAEKKYIFVDGFTTWCGPCKYMAKEIFPLEETGTFFNANFINVKAQLDTTANDSEEIKKWYQDAHNLMVDYQIRAFPTYLYFNPDGELVHRALGSTNAPEFIKWAKNALNPKTQYYSMKKEYAAGKKDTAFLHALALASQQAYDEPFSSEVVNKYIATQSNLYRADIIGMLASATNKTTDPGFKVFTENPEKADAFLRPGTSANIVKSIIGKEVLPSLIYKEGNTYKDNIDWENVKATLRKQYPAFGDEIALPAQINYYKQTQNWPKFSETVSTYLAGLGAKANPSVLNNYAWAVFENCDDVACMNKALAWSKQSLSGEAANEPGFMDTYANLLYKLGKKDEAIKVEQEAVAKDPSLQGTLDKMKQGKPTWD